VICSFGISDTLVKFSKDIISLDEFTNRCDFSYPLKKNNISDDSLKKEFLFSLIAENLWAAECEKLNLDTTAEFQSLLYPVKKFFIVDELFSEVITSKIKITPDDITDGMTKFRENLKLQILSAADSDAIYNTYDLLSDGKTFQELPKSINRTNEPVEIIFGQIQDEKAENIIYKLNAGYFSKPVSSSGKWFIFKMIERNKRDINDMTQDALRMNVEQIILRRRSSNLENRYRDSLFSHLRIETNGEVFKKLCSVVSEIMTERFKEKDWDTSKPVVLYQSDLDRIFKGVGADNSYKPFILFEKNPLSFREALFLLPYKPFKIKSPTLSKVTNVFKSYFRYIIEQEILYREAIKKNIQYRKNVQGKITLWKKSYQAGMYSAYIWNTFSKPSVNKPGNEISYKVLASNTIDGMLKNIESIMKGGTFDSLYQLSNGYMLSGDDSVFTSKIQASIDQQISSKSDSLHKGILGPFQIRGDYVLLKRSNKNEYQKDTLSTLPKSKRLFEDIMEKNTASLYLKYNVQINSSLLQNIKISPLNTFTVQHLGFGNELPAFPVAVPYYEWFFRLTKNPLP
jgi:hypothetical protein